MVREKKAARNGRRTAGGGCHYIFSYGTSISCILPSFGAVQDHDLAFGIAEDEDVAVPEVSFLDRLFQRHGTHGHRFIGTDQVNLGGSGDRRILVHHHRDGGFFVKANGGLNVLLVGVCRSTSFLLRSCGQNVFWTASGSCI